MLDGRRHSLIDRRIAPAPERVIIAYSQIPTYGIEQTRVTRAIPMNRANGLAESVGDWLFRNSTEPITRPKAIDPEYRIILPATEANDATGITRTEAISSGEPMIASPLDKRTLPASAVPSPMTRIIRNPIRTIRLTNPAARDTENLLFN